MNRPYFVSLILAFVTLFTPVSLIAVYESRPPLPIAVPKASPPALPDFSAIHDVHEKKRRFFAYLAPIVLQQNLALLLQRETLMASLPYAPAVDALCHFYSKNCGYINDSKLMQLKQRVDVIPPSLALAQAAMESGWGTSRFAKQAFNFFGQWCFDKGCGLVPKQRGGEQQHEVRKFATPLASVSSYMVNLNTHRRYQALRDKRWALRMAGRNVVGKDLTFALQHYSQRGEAYVDELNAIIRVNQLQQRYDEPFWQLLALMNTASTQSILAMQSHHKQGSQKKPL